MHWFGFQGQSSHMNSQTSSGQASSGRSSRDCFPYFRQITTRWMDNDVYGHVNNVIYYSFFDTAVNATLIERGQLDPLTSKVIGLVVETGCRYAAALSFPETVDAGIRVARIGTSSVRYEVGLFRQGDELAAAEGFFVHVYVDAANRRPTPVPADLRSFLETLA